MPLYDFGCTSCGQEHEALVKSDVLVLPCPDCGEETHRLVSMPARTSASWGDSQGYFDRGLGCYVENSQHRNRLMKKRGLAPASDFSNSVVDDYVHKNIVEKQEHERNVSRFKDNLKRTGDAALAVAETFPAHTKE